MSLQPSSGVVFSPTSRIPSSQHKRRRAMRSFLIPQPITFLTSRKKAAALSCLTSGTLGDQTTVTVPRLSRTSPLAPTQTNKMNPVVFFEAKRVPIHHTRVCNPKKTVPSLLPSSNTAKRH
jgi:hypothetical protein